MTPGTNASSTDPSLDQRVEELLAKLTLREKVALLSGQDSWSTVAIERLGIPSLTMTDGTHGVRADQAAAGRLAGPATSFPTGVCMASSWDPDLVRRIGAALGEESRALGCDILLGPCINIVRTPLAGRNFESYSEDPYLAGRIGIAFVQGVQSQGVGASVKHYACNNQETERSRASSVVDERTLREIYLAHFEAIVREARPWTVMCSYNRINGVYASQNQHLLKQILKGEWSFDGVVVSDWGANHTTVESVQAGLDIEMPGPAKYYGQLLVEAVDNWQIDQAAVDDAVRRILRMIMRSGKMDVPAARPAGALNTPEHQALARELAEESIVLLKNEGGLLPLDAGRVRSIAVIGPNAGQMTQSGGGSACLESPYQVSPLQGLKARLGQQVEVRYEKGCDNYVELPLLRTDLVSLPDGSGPGLRAEYFDNTTFSGPPVLERVDSRVDFWWGAVGPARRIGNRFSARWSGRLAPAESGSHTFELVHSGVARLYLDGRLLLETTAEQAGGETTLVRASAEAKLPAGRYYDLHLDFVRSAEAVFGHVRLMFAATPPPQEQDARLARALELARSCDVALVFAGMPERYETEGGDRPDLELPGRQNELIRAVAAANPNTVVILNCGAPVTMPWLDQVPALVDALYPGMEGGNAIARVLLGEVNPSGKLPVTFPRRLEDTPCFTNVSFPGAREVRYGEGIFVGYRYYDRKEVEPLFPFGFGLSYTTFAYSDLQVPERARAAEPVEVSVRVANTGPREGKEVVQLYVGDSESSLPRPPKELKGFAKVVLQPGESRVVRFVLDRRAFSFYDPGQRQWVTEPGRFDVLVGSSSRDIRGWATLTLE